MGVAFLTEGLLYCTRTAKTMGAYETVRAMQTVERGIGVQYSPKDFNPRPRIGSDLPPMDGQVSAIISSGQ